MEPYFILGILLWQFANMNLSGTIQNTYLNLNIIVNFILITILILVIVSFIKVRKKVLDLWNKNENLREENLKLLNSLASIHRAEELSEKLVDEGSVDIRKLLGFTGQFEYLNEDQAINTSHVRVEGNYVNLKHKDKVKYILVRDRLKNLYNHWQKYHFVQSHKSYLVNMKMISQVSWNEISLSDGSKVPLSRTHKKEFQDAYALFLKKNHGIDSI